MSRSAPSSPVFGVRDHETLSVLRMRRSGGGVCGGDEVMRVEELRLKLCTGRSASSSSLNSGDGGSSGIVDPSEINDSCVRLFEENRACLVWLIGDDSGRWLLFFHETCLPELVLFLLAVAAPEEGSFGMFDCLIFLLLRLLPERWKSSEKTGAVNGDEARLE